MMGTSWRIGFIGPEVVYDAFHAVIIGASEAASGGGHRLSVYSSTRFLQGVVLRSNAFNEPNVVDRFADPDTLDAVALYAPGLMPRMSPSDIADFLHGLQVPAVVMGLAIDSIPSIAFDVAGAMDRMIGHLVGTHGARRIAYLSESVDSPEDREKLDGIRSAALRADVEVVEERMSVRSADPLSISQALDAVFGQKGTPLDALVCGSDALAFHVIEQLRKRDIRVPVDIAVTGYGDLPWSRLSTPSITTTRKDLRALGARAVGLCIDRLEGTVDSLVLDPTPAYRYSCGCDPWLSRGSLRPVVAESPEYRTALEAINAAVDTEDAQALRGTLGRLIDRIAGGGYDLLRQAVDASRAGPLDESPSPEAAVVRAVVEMEAVKAESLSERNIRLAADDLTMDATVLTGSLDEVVEIDQFQRMAGDIFSRLGIHDYRVIRIIGPSTAAVISQWEGLPTRSSLEGPETLTSLIAEMVASADNGAVTTTVSLPFNADILGYAVFNLLPEQVHMLDTLSSSLGSMLNRLRLLEVLDETESARREAFRKQVEAQDQLVHSERLASLGMLVANVAHQLNTPIGVATTALSHLRSTVETIVANQADGGCSPEGLDMFATAVDLIESSVRRSADIVARFGSIVPLAENIGHPEIDLRQSVDAVLASLRSELGSAGIRVEVDIVQPLLFRVPADSLERILFALVSNSIDHAFDGCSDRCILIRVDGDEEGATIEYSDNGNGVDDAVLSVLFEPFTTTKRVKGKLGLGLHAVHNLVTGTLKGTVRAASPHDEGLAISISLPSAAVCADPLKESPGSP